MARRAAEKGSDGAAREAQENFSEALRGTPPVFAWNLSFCASDAKCRTIGAMMS
jgi:hypothetical protein